MSELLTGIHPVLEALRAGRRHFFRLWVEGKEPLQPKGDLAEILALAEERRVPVRVSQGGLFDRRKREGVRHQGVALEVGGYPYVSIEDVLAGVRKRGGEPFLLLLDRLQDPQNVGSLLRTAEAMAVDGVVIPEHRSAGITAAVSRASAGAVEHLAVARVPNLNRLIDRLKGDNIWVAGLDVVPEAQELTQADLTGPLAVVVGSEGPGLARLTREKCDFLVRIPMYGRVQSLNAAAAGSIVVYEARMQREGKKVGVRGQA